jgi:hypothetical protein
MTSAQLTNRPISRPEGVLETVPGMVLSRHSEDIHPSFDLAAFSTRVTTDQFLNPFAEDVFSLPFAGVASAFARPDWLGGVLWEEC